MNLKNLVVTSIADSSHPVLQHYAEESALHATPLIVIGDLKRWNILFHQATVWQERNDHDLMKDFEDEIPGYLNNNTIFSELQKLSLKPGKEHVPDNLITCYRKFIDLNLIDSAEMPLLTAWLADLRAIGIG